MSKPRQGPALFEVFDRNSATAAKSSATAVPPSAESALVHEPRPAFARPDAHPSRVKATDSAERALAIVKPPGFIHLDEQHLSLTFTAKRAAITIFLVLTMLGASYFVGDRFGSGAYHRGLAAGKAVALREPTDEIEVLRNSPPASELVDGLLVGQNNVVTPASRPVSKEPRRATSSSFSKWMEGFTYVVVQEFAAGRTEEAEQARSFLAERGVSAELVTRAGGVIFLVATTGYNTKEPAQKEAADKFLEKVHGLGADYYASGGRYRLKGYFKTMKADEW